MYFNGKSLPDLNKADFRNTYSSLSGVDMKAVFAGVGIGTLQAISYSITREKAPIFTMGSPEPRAFARGKRGIAGSMVFIMFDAHSLLEHFHDLISKYESGGAGKTPHSPYSFVSDHDEIRPPLSNGSDFNPNATYKVNQAAANNNPGFTAGLSRNIELPVEGDLDQAWSRSRPWYMDQVPSFNVVLTGVNEEGMAARMGVLGVEVMNEGYGVSIDDTVSEMQFTYISRSISPWTRVLGNNFQNGEDIIKGSSSQMKDLADLQKSFGIK